MKDDFLESLLQIIKSKKEEDPNLSYTTSLHKKGLNEILKKIGEEASEIIIAAKSDNKDELIHEIADLWFHCLVLLSKKDLTVDDVTNELKKRLGTSGIEEKKNRK
jgi:phosphoribosyl-ATP pyrophosphohydrolase